MLYSLRGQSSCGGFSRAFGRAFGRAFAELGAELGAEPLQGSVELSAELLQSFGRTQYFDVRHVDSAITYRALFFF